MQEKKRKHIYLQSNYVVTGICNKNINRMTDDGIDGW